MAYSFASDWAAEIEAVSSRPEYQNATIRLWFGGAKLFTDAVSARIITITTPVDASGLASGNQTAVKHMRVQFPFASYTTKVQRGSFVEVVDGGRNPALTTALIAVQADNLSSQRASHTLECTVDVEAIASWA